jgi:hypothetical protein
MRFIRIFFAGFLFVFTAFSLSGSMGCKSTELAGVGANDDVNATGQDAEDTATAAENVALRAFTASFGTPVALKLDPHAAVILSRLKNAIVTDTISRCEAPALPVPSGSSDVNISGSVGGLCAVRYSGDSSSGDARANCTAYDDGENTGFAKVDGLIGIHGESVATEEETFVQFDTITSSSLELTLADQDNCSAVLNLAADVTIQNATGAGTANLDGCVSICGEAFDISGSIVF